MKSIKIGGAALAFLFVLVVLTPQEKLDRLGLALSRANGNPGTLCLDYQRRYLKDPISAELLEQSGKKESETSIEVNIKYRAKNSYGAYQTSTAICVITNGEINETSTEVTRTIHKLKEEISALDESNDCLEKFNKFGRSGDSASVARSKLSSRCLEIMKSD